ncbi:MAG TPA: shikimate dehydrogenase [Rhizomicrobium sp.]|jgi:shikimate dehydrogenase
MTVPAGVAGWPIAHSLSPRLHGYWLQEYGIDGVYVPLPIAREDFSVAVDGLRRAGFAGLNVTVPHKEAAFAMAQTLDEDARITGAVNLLLFHRDGTIGGRNTDAMGLAASVAEEFGPDVTHGKTAVLLGAGGAARAAILALARLGAAKIRIVNRSHGKGETLARQLQPHVSCRLTAAGFEDWPVSASETALVVNATSAGMKGNPPLDLSLAALPATAAVYDLVYNPLETSLTKQARERGLRSVGGLGMLIQQAVPAFAAFYGVTPTVTPQLRACLQQALAA